MHRVSIIGRSGSGKSTLADRLQQKTGIAYGRHQTRFETMCRDPKMTHVTFHRLRGTREVARWTDTFTQDFTSKTND